MPTYETVFITVPTLSEDEERTTVGAFAQVIADGGATLVTADRMGRRRLAYPIRKFDDGVYTRFLYDAEGQVPRELERRMRISDRVLRHLTVRLEPDWAVAAKEQVVRDAQARAEAEARQAEMGELGEGEPGLVGDEERAGARPRAGDEPMRRPADLDDELGDDADLAEERNDG